MLSLILAANIAVPIFMLTDDAAKEVYDKLDVKESKDPASGEKTIAGELELRCETTQKLVSCKISGEKGKELLSVSGKTAGEMLATMKGDGASKTFKGKAHLRCYCSYRDGKSSAHYCSLKEDQAAQSDGPTGALVAP